MDSGQLTIANPNTDDFADWLRLAEEALSTTTLDRRVDFVPPRWRRPN